MEENSSSNYKVTLSLLALILIVALKKLFLRTTKHRKNHPPGPPSIPIIGHLYLLKPPLHRTAQRLAHKYGPVVALRFGYRGVILVSSPEAVEECFTKHDIVLANRPRLLFSHHIGYKSTTVASSPYGDHWRNLRRIAAIEIFSASRLKAFAGIRRDEVNRLMINKLSGSSTDAGFARVEMKSLLSEMTLNIIMRMVAGKRYYGDVDAANADEAVRFRRIMKEVAAAVGVANPADFLPVLRWFGGGGGGYLKKLMRLAKDTDEFLQGLVDEVRGRSEDRNTMIDHLLSLKESQPEYYTDEIIKGLILVLLLAGTDTTSVTLEWAMSNLLNHPQVLKKAKAEIVTKIGEQNLVEDSDLSKLDYLQSIILETLRLYPAAPLLVPHLSSEDFTVCGYHVPRDTMVLVNAWSIHRDPKLWEDAESFKPERYEGMSELSNKLLPFGQGRRACPGAGLAQRVVGLALASMIQCFEWERVGEELVDMNEGKGVTLPKAIPLEALCKPRPLLNNVVLSQNVEASV